MTEPRSWRCPDCDTWNVVGRDLVCHCCGSPADTSPVKQATTAAVAASAQSDQYAVMLAAVQAAQTIQQQPQHTCQHQAPVRQPVSVGKWTAVAVAGSVCAISLALSAIAVAVGAVAVTGCLIVLRSMWREHQKGH